MSISTNSQVSGAPNINVTNISTGSSTIPGLTVNGNVWNINGNIGKRIVVVGDSFAGYSNLPVSVSAITASSGVVTVTAAGHNGYPGCLISIVGAADMNANVHQVPMTYISSTQFSYSAPGVADGTVTNDGATIQVLVLGIQSDNGLITQLQRQTSGAFLFVSNAGCPGRTSTQVLNYWAQRVTPYNPDIVYWDCYYNDLNLGVSTATTIANVKTAIELSGGALVLVSSAWPIGSGAAANSAANLQKMVDYNRQLENLCRNYKNVIYIDNYSSFVSKTTGLISNTNHLFADGIHPSWEGRRLSVATFLPQISNYYRARSFVSTGIDNVGTNAANVNISRFMPKDVTTGGGLGTGVTGAVATTDGVTGAAAAGTAGVANGFTASGTNITTAVAWIKTGTDGFPYQACQYSVFSNTSGQCRLSTTLTNADVTPGGNLSFSFIGSVGTAAAASNKTPAGQSITGIYAQLVITIDTVTYTIYEAKPATNLNANTQTTDLVNYAFIFDNVNVPTGASISLVRLDLIVTTTSTTPNIQLDMGRVKVIKNS